MQEAFTMLFEKGYVFHEVRALVTRLWGEDNDNLYTVAAIYFWTLHEKDTQNFFLLILLQVTEIPNHENL